MLVHKLYGYYHYNKQYEDIRAQINSTNSAEKFSKEFYTSSPGSKDPAIHNTPEALLPYTIEAGNPVELNKDGILSIYDKLKKQNSDLVGWIEMPGFKNPISYPVMQSTEEAFLSPSFNTLIRKFSTKLPPGAENITLFFKTADPKSTVNVTQNGKKATSMSLSLIDGENIIKVCVTSRDKQYSRTSTIIITK